jgi:nitrite reductase/ring-hydroxylating ferredoxin subunit
MHRRGFLTGIVAAVNGLIGCFVALPGLRFLLDPLWRSRTRSGFIRVIPLAAVSRGKPMRVTVSADRWDAYTHYPPGPIGSVWLIREDEEGGSAPSFGVGEGWGTDKTLEDHASPPLLRKDGAPPAGGAKTILALPRVRCLQTICPHLGCGIGYAADRGAFSCPCHASEFDAAGRRLSGPAPRDMDELECRVTEPDENGRRWVEVRYQEFQTGLSARRPVA